MKRIQYLVTTLLLSLGVVGASATTFEPEYVCVTQHDGTVLVFSVDSHPTAYPYGEVMCFKTTQQQIDVQFMDIKDVKITTSLPESVETVQTEKEHARISQGDIVISGAQAGSSVSVYDASGILVTGGKVAEDGSLYLPLSTQKAGVYIVKTAGSTFKIQK